MEMGRHFGRPITLHASAARVGSLRLPPEPALASCARSRRPWDRPRGPSEGHLGPQRAQGQAPWSLGASSGVPCVTVAMQAASFLWLQFRCLCRCCALTLPCCDMRNCPYAAWCRPPGARRGLGIPGLPGVVSPGPSEPQQDSPEQRRAAFWRTVMFNLAVLVVLVGAVSWCELWCCMWGGFQCLRWGGSFRCTGFEIAF